MISPRTSRRPPAQGDVPRLNLDAVGGSSSGVSSPGVSGSWMSSFTSATPLVPGARRVVPPSKSARGAAAAAAVASPGESSGGASPGPSPPPSFGGPPTPPRDSSGFSTTRVSDDFSSGLCASLDVSGAEGLTLNPGLSARFDPDGAAPPSRPPFVEVAPEARRSGRHSSVSSIPEVSDAHSVESVVGAAEDARPASCEVAEGGADYSPLGSALIPAALGPAVGSRMRQRRNSCGGCTAKQPVATVSIATRHFWLRFENDEIESM